MSKHAINKFNIQHAQTERNDWSMLLSMGVGEQSGSYEKAAHSSMEDYETYLGSSWTKETRRK